MFEFCFDRCFKTVDMIHAATADMWSLMHDIVYFESMRVQHKLVHSLEPCTVGG